MSLSRKSIRRPSAGSPWIAAATQTENAGLVRWETAPGTLFVAAFGSKPLLGKRNAPQFRPPAFSESQKFSQ
jgi:hypothetical protein